MLAKRSINSNKRRGLLPNNKHTKTSAKQTTFTAFTQKHTYKPCATTYSRIMLESSRKPSAKVGQAT